LTKTPKEIDFSKLFNLLDEKSLNDIGIQLVEQAINGEKVEYEDHEVKITVPSTVMRLLESLTEIFPVDLDTVLSKMASQGINNILQGVTPSPQETNENLLDNIEPINKISDQLSDLQNVINRFSDMQKIFGDLTNGTSDINTKQNKEDS